MATLAVGNELVKMANDDDIYNPQVEMGHTRSSCTQSGPCEDSGLK